jgi:hypothetical protein
MSYDEKAWSIIVPDISLYPSQLSKPYNESMIALSQCLTVGIGIQPFLPITESYNKVIRSEEMWYMANVPQLRAVLMHNATRRSWTQPLAVIYWPYTPHLLGPYCYYKLVTNVIRAVYIRVVIPVVDGLIYHSCQSISIQGLNHPVYRLI